MSVSSSDKTMCVDRLSELPDDILCYILSFLGMKEASITCLLSKRWQFLWTKLPSLRFGCRPFFTERVQKFVNRVNKTLAICSRHNLERFEVMFNGINCGSISSDVDFWIAFAIENKVKKFSLLVQGTGMCYFTSPQMMFSNPSWTSLALQELIMAPPGTIEWPSLMTLYIEDVELDEDIFGKIFSGCPVLNSFDLVHCRGFHRLEVNSRSLHKLTITDRGCDDNLEISAPHLRTFSYWKYKNTNLCLENIESLVRAEITVRHGGSERGDIIMKLIESTRHVKMLKLEDSFMEDLSSIAPKFQLPQSTRECLELYADFHKRSVPGIVGLLESSPNLEILVINGYEFYHLDDTSRIPASIDDLDSNLFHLKSVCFKNFRQRDLENSEMMLTVARILLKRAIVLEKMKFCFEGIKRYSTTLGFQVRVQKLLSYPRVSQKAVHFIIASNNGVHFSSLQPCC